MNADGTGQTRTTYNMATDYGPEWSVTFNKIVFASTRDGIYEQIYISRAKVDMGMSFHAYVSLGNEGFNRSWF